MTKKKQIIHLSEVGASADLKLNCLVFFSSQYPINIVLCPISDIALHNKEKL